MISHSLRGGSKVTHNTRQVIIYTQSVSQQQPGTTARKAMSLRTIFSTSDDYFFNEVLFMVTFIVLFPCRAKPLEHRCCVVHKIS